MCQLFSRLFSKSLKVQQVVKLFETAKLWKCSRWWNFAARNGAILGPKKKLPKKLAHRKKSTILRIFDSNFKLKLAIQKNSGSRNFRKIRYLEPPPNWPPNSSQTRWDERYVLSYYIGVWKTALNFVKFFLKVGVKYKDLRTKAV